MPQHSHQEHGKSEMGWSEAAHEASKNLFTRLEGEHGEGNVKFVSVKAVEFWAEVKPNPGSIHTFRTVIDVTAEHP